LERTKAGHYAYHAWSTPGLIDRNGSPKSRRGLIKQH
jgi:hypothetical protein